MNRRLRLLYLAYFFPPVQTVACVRSWNTAVHLARLDWDVSVVTPNAMLWRPTVSLASAGSPNTGDRWWRISTGHRWRFLNSGYLHCADWGPARLRNYFCCGMAIHLPVSLAAGWNRPVMKACRDFRPGDIDVVLATGGPFNAFQLASRLAKQLRCPHVLDYRDGWTVGTPHLDRPGPLFWRERRAERRALAGAAAVTTVSPSLTRILADAFPVREKLHVLPNGYDRDEMNGVQPHDFGHFAIVYAGQFYPPRREITPLMAALARLRQFGTDVLPRWRFHYYGPQDDQVQERANRYGLGDCIILHGKRPRGEVLAAIKGAGVSVVIASVRPIGTPAEQSMVTGKVFEAVGLQKPILAIAPAGSDLDGIFETVGLGQRFAGDQIDEMAAFLTDVMRGAAPPLRNLEAYAWPTLVKKLDAILRSTLADRNI